MNTSVIKKIWATLSISAIVTTIIATPAFADPSISYGRKGTYTVNDDLSYHGCLYSGGCISIGRKYLINRNNPEAEGISWKKGEYTYTLSEGYINVRKNGRLIFEDSALSTRP